ncbi:MAG TPA: hypothetical protein VIL86_13460 [Tepidisphaeraceae bacterium]|jgi:hypothetical protein
MVLFCDRSLRAARFVTMLLICNCGGCTTTTHHGDAKLIYFHPTFSTVGHYNLKLPPVDLRETGTSIFKVRALPTPFYPDTFGDFPEVYEEFGPARKSQTAWRDAVVTFAIAPVGEQVIFVRTYRLGDIANGGGVGGRFFRQNDEESLPRLTSYEIHVTVNRAVASPHRLHFSAYHEVP